MNKQEAIEYWTEQQRHAEAALKYATEQLGKLTVDEMLLGQDEPVTNEIWPGASDMGEYLDRTIPDIAGREL